MYLCDKSVEIPISQEVAPLSKTELWFVVGVLVACVVAMAVFLTTMSDDQRGKRYGVPGIIVGPLLCGYQVVMAIFVFIPSVVTWRRRGDSWRNVGRLLARRFIAANTIW